MTEEKPLTWWMYVGFVVLFLAIVALLTVVLT